MAVRIAGVFGTSFETILPMTGTLVMSAEQAAVNLVVGTSGLAATVTLPQISQMVAAQNPVIYLVNTSSSGGTMTIAAFSGDSIVGATTALVSTGVQARHDGLKTWYIF